MQKRAMVYSTLSLIAGLFLGIMLMKALRTHGNNVTAVAWSSDYSEVVRLYEMNHIIDRNFRVTFMTDGNERTIFQSPDEGKPIGSERFVWSLDNKFVLLAGKHFFGRADAALPTGETAYMLFSIETGEIWCNATQAPQFNGFTIDDMLKKSTWPNDFRLELPVKE